jgi:tellurite resistance protein
MDPVTTAIVVATSGGMTQVAEKMVLDAYEGLKSLIRKKFGIDSDIVVAVETLEDKPKSKARQAMLQEEVENAEADKESEILKAALALIDKLKTQPNGAQAIQNIQNVYGDYSAVAGSHGTATVNVN